jgi:hypothetical protein
MFWRGLLLPFQFLLYAALSRTSEPEDRQMWAILGKSRPREGGMDASFTSSRLQREVASTFRDMGFRVKEEYLDRYISASTIRFWLAFTGAHWGTVFAVHKLFKWGAEICEPTSYLTVWYRNSGYLFDVWIEDLELAVEVDGPSHFSR